MRCINIDLSSDNYLQQPQIFGGFAGEHNETVLQVKLPKRMIGIECSGYRFDFQTSEDNKISSPLIPVSKLKNDILSFYLTEQLTVEGKLFFTVVAILSDKKTVSLISKTKKVILNIDGTPTGAQVPIDPNGHKDELLEMVDARILEIAKVDQTYNPDSENAQSGKAVAEAIAGIEIPECEDITVDQSYNAESENAQSGKAVAEAVNGKQDILFSGINIKTINESSILGSGNIDIDTNITIDNELSLTSDNPVKNKVITEALNDILDDIYITEDVVGIQVDYQNKVFERLAGAQGLSAGEDFNSFHAFGGRRRCNVADDGTILAYYGDDNYADDGSNGQVMVYQPAFYYRVVPLVFDKNTTTGVGYHLRKANYYISDVPYLGFRLHPAFYDENGNEVEYVLMSAYEGSMYNVSASEYVNDGTNTSTVIEAGDLLCSVAGVKPISGFKKVLSKTNAEIMASNRGSGWHLETIKITSANQLLMMVELGTMNTQTAIGPGVVSVFDNSSYNCSSYTGSTASLGNTTGQATETINEIGGTETTHTASSRLSITYRGVENPWGNIWKHIQGINIYGDGTVGGGQPYVANNFVFSESKNSDNYEPVGFTLPNTNGYVNAMGYGSKEFDWLLMPSDVGGTSALPVGDYCWVTSNLKDYRIALLGGDWLISTYAGGFYWGCANCVSDRYRDIGGRLVYIPTGENTTTKS